MFVHVMHQCHVHVMHQSIIFAVLRVYVLAPTHLKYKYTKQWFFTVIFLTFDLFHKANLKTKTVIYRHVL